MQNTWFKKALVCVLLAIPTPALMATVFTLAGGNKIFGFVQATAAGS